MVAYQIAKSLLTPPGVIVLIMAGAFLLARGVLARLLIFVATALLALLSIPAVATLLMTPLEPYAALDPDTVPADAQAILVLSAGRYSSAPEYGGDTLDGISLQRIRYAALLQRRTGLPLYCSGGNPERREQSMAALMERVLREELQVPVAGTETESRTSWENAAYSKPMLERDGIGHVLLVTTAWHLPRAVEAFERAGIRVTPAPTGFVHRPGVDGDSDLGDWLPSAYAFHTSYYAVHEHLGRVWYQLRQWAEGSPRAAEGEATVAGGSRVPPS